MDGYWPRSATRASLRRVSRGSVADSLRESELLLVASDDITYAQASRTLNMSEGAIRVAEHRLRKRYRQLLRNEIAKTVGSDLTNRAPRFDFTETAVVSFEEGCYHLPPLEDQTMSTDPYDDILNRAKGQLSQEQQQRLVEELAQHAGRKIGPQQHSIMELKGLGKDIWQGIDPDQYVAKERDAWDG